MADRSARVLAALAGLALVASAGAAEPAAAHTSSTPEATANATGTPTGGCPVVRLLVDPRNTASGRVVAPVNGPVHLHAQADRPDARYQLERGARHGMAAVRQGSGTSSDWTIYPSQNSSFQVRAIHPPAVCPASAPVRTYVQPRLSISARRNTPRDYTFTGRVLPGRGQTVTLYRCEATSTRCVITAQGQVQSDGSYHINRHFLGSGRFGFYAAVSDSPTNLAGASRVRPTFIH